MPVVSAVQENLGDFWLADVSVTGTFYSVPSFQKIKGNARLLIQTRGMQKGLPYQDGIYTWLPK